MELTIKELAETIKEILNYKGKIYFDTNKLDGSPRKLIDSSRLNSLGWRPKINLKEGLIKTYLHFEKSKCLMLSALIFTSNALAISLTLDLIGLPFKLIF